MFTFAESSLFLVVPASVGLYEVVDAVMMKFERPLTGKDGRSYGKKLFSNFLGRLASHKTAIEVQSMMHRE